MSAGLAAAPTALTHVDSRDIATGEVMATYAAMDADAVADVVRRARSATAVWGRLGFDQRRMRLEAWATDLVDHSEELVTLIHRESGKPEADAYLELVIAVEHIRWAARNAKRVLRSRRIRPTVLMANYAGVIDREPFGVVGVISPWNYPLFAPVAPIASALAAGNAVVLKPSEHTTGVGAELVAAFARANADLPGQLLALATGSAAAGAGLIAAPVDKLAFTGSPRTGRLILEACAKTLTPTVMECGGKDALIVAPDADVEQAADGAAWGGFSNAGQTCVGVERIYVHRDVAEAFIAALKRRLSRVQIGTDVGSTYGPMMLARQGETMRAQVQAAIQGGAGAPLGGAERVHGQFGEPILLVDADESSQAVQEETFGPMVTVRTVSSVEEAIRLANGTPFGLGAAVYSRREGRRIASALRCGMVSINSVIAFVSIPALPFGGVGESGFGRIHGDEGLRTFSRTKSVSTKLYDIPAMNGMLLFRPRITLWALKKMTNLRFGRTGRR
ncbi:aldehyde dehydrogenase family protein [Mycobacterium sp. CVI_P3]|uniref:Aldehyde dehydrogenase n=1 Tax=Mycobacterium pinniadriaticum TaxID=2994102 RepID=A0ABT3SCA6_9MYCO|nr:aldehyde dehydrogenase family protein [Mycobacterium pinniadriaticum]MCX2930676.1 aldehyde dehydrogenase family protein [Mycobacterium pinniadriaticum]MCX2937100.1 aldehyde dehydrogenase family protein [Mycobacterium pinniadriaticum]